MPPKDWSESEYQARQERIREWAVFLAYICGQPRACQALAYLMRRYAPPADAQ